MTPGSDEINPFLVYRLSGSQVECALWQVQEGGQALALFLTEESAQRYCTAANLGPAWKVIRPPRAGLLELLKTAASNGIAHAVLDPDGEKARRVFNIAEILAAVAALTLPTPPAR